MRLIRSLDDAQIAIRELYGFFDKLNSKDIDMSKRRVVNASPSKEPYDYVVRKELDQFKASYVEEVQGSGGSVTTAGVYTLVFCNNGTPRVHNPAAPYYIIKRNSVLTCINIIAEEGPNPGASAQFNLYCNGSLINTTVLEILDSYTPGSILTFTDFNITSFSPEQVVSLEAVSVNGVSNITVELYFRES